MRRITVLLVAALASAPAVAMEAKGEAKLAELLQGRVAGPPRSCITRLRPDDDSTIIEGVGQVYDVGATRYVNRFADGCPGLTLNAVTSTRTPTTSLCAGDIVLLRDRYTPQVSLGSCALGKFTPYTRAR